MGGVGLEARSGHGGINRCAVLVGPVVYRGALHAVQGRVVSVLTDSGAVDLEWSIDVFFRFVSILQPTNFSSPQL
jgi:hypothetical protein